MSLNISNSVRSSNPYLAEVDKVQGQVSLIDGRVSTLEGGGGGFSSYIWNATSTQGSSSANDGATATFEFYKVGNMVVMTLVTNINEMINRQKMLTFNNMPAEFIPKTRCVYTIKGELNSLIDNNSAVLNLDIIDTGNVQFSVNDVSAGQTGGANAPNFTIGNQITVFKFSVCYITN